MTWQTFQKKLRELHLHINQSRLSSTQKESLFQTILENLKHITRLLLADNDEQVDNSNEINTLNTYANHVHRMLTHRATMPKLLKAYSLFITEVSDSMHSYIK